MPVYFATTGCFKSERNKVYIQRLKNPSTIIVIDKYNSFIDVCVVDFLLEISQIL